MLNSHTVIKLMSMVFKIKFGWKTDSHMAVYITNRKIVSIVTSQALDLMSLATSKSLAAKFRVVNLSLSVLSVAHYLPREKKTNQILWNLIHTSYLIYSLSWDGQFANFRSIIWEWSTYTTDVISRPVEIS